MRHTFVDEGTSYEFELHRITPSEFERLRQNDALTWDGENSRYKLHEDVVATEISRNHLYERKDKRIFYGTKSVKIGPIDTVPAMLLPWEIGINLDAKLMKDRLISAIRKMNKVTTNAMEQNR